MERYREEIPRGRSWPVCEDVGDYYDLSGGEQSPHRVFDLGWNTRKTIDDGLQGTQAHQRLRIVGTRSVEGPQAPDSRPSRWHRPCGHRRSEIWQRGSRPHASSASCEIDFVQTSFQPTATHF